jgi:hypothetical protein
MASAPPSTEDLQAWLTAKRQALTAARELERLEPVRQWLLNHDEGDQLAAAFGLEITRPDRTAYHWQRDQQLAALLERQDQLRLQIQAAQQHFKLQCVSGERDLDVDFTPARQITVQLRRL